MASVTTSHNAEGLSEWKLRGYIKHHCSHTMTFIVGGQSWHIDNLLTCSQYLYTLDVTSVLVYEDCLAGSWSLSWRVVHARELLSPRRHEIKFGDIDDGSAISEIRDRGQEVQRHEPASIKLTFSSANPRDGGELGIRSSLPRSFMKSYAPCSPLPIHTSASGNSLIWETYHIYPPMLAQN